MLKRFKYIFLLLIVVSCIEPYQFRIKNNNPGLVIEGTLSNKSYNDSRVYPSDGRYFTVKLSRTSDVINVRSEVVSYATVVLVSDAGDQWNLTESETPGTYELVDNDFKAQEGLSYKLRITLPNDEQIESAWEAMPSVEPMMGGIGFRETTTKRFVLGKVTSINGITPYISLTENETGKTVYYRWKFSPTWIFVAPLAATTDNNIKTCWATNNFYIRNFALLKDKDGGYNNDLFFMDIEQNERVLHEFSLLVEQNAMTEEYFQFWNEMQGLNQPGGIFSTPPFNLKTNFTSSHGVGVFGYFGVVREQAKRWYFNKDDLSYRIGDWYSAQCNEPCVGPGCPPVECSTCLEYQGGEPSNVRPSWWGR
jgi:hypothetical protein